MKHLSDKGCYFRMKKQPANLLFASLKPSIIFIKIHICKFDKKYRLLTATRFLIWCTCVPSNSRLELSASSPNNFKIDHIKEFRYFYFIGNDYFFIWLQVLKLSFTQIQNINFQTPLFLSCSRYSNTGIYRAVDLSSTFCLRNVSGKTK